VRDCDGEGKVANNETSVLGGLKYIIKFSNKHNQNQFPFTQVDKYKKN
jgi:hypothetical protein